MAKSKKKFKTEVQQLLNLVINSLYSNKDIFLRELISNASDAIDRVRFDALSDEKLLENDPDWKIKLYLDKDENTLKIVDNGIGMTQEEVENNIGTIAKSGTKAFMESMSGKDAQNNPELIGQFGVGFYSAFMIADKVTLETRKAGTKKSEGIRWESDGTGSYTIESAEKENRGTEITLHLKEDQGEFLEEWKIRKIVKSYSDYVEHPVLMDIYREEVERDEEGKEIEGAEKKTTITEETLNSQKALWTRSKSEIKDDEYNEFYKHISTDYADPAKVIHYKAEGTLEFSSILFLPAKAPYDLFNSNENTGVQLYVKRIFIMDDCKALMPDYLRFIKGVVDASDLPLNVSREILQEDALLGKIKTNLTKKVLDAMKAMMDKDYDKYVAFFKEFGKVIKEGTHSDFANKEKITDLLLFTTSTTEDDKVTTLKDYVTRMPETQKEIFYITGHSDDAVSKSPHLEIFHKKGIEVIYLTDPIDEWVVSSITEYDGKPLKSIMKGDINLEEKDKEKEEKKASKFEKLTEKLQKILNEDVKEVRITNRLTDSACCLVADDHAMSANMERIFQSMNQDVPPVKRTMEINPDHALIKKLSTFVKDNSKSKKIDEYATLLLDQALLTEGSPIKNPLQFTKSISKLMASEL